MSPSRPPRGAGLVLGVMAAGTVLVAGWFAAGHPSAPDHGLQQIDVLMLDERVPGVDAVDGLPTLFVVVGRCPGAPTPLRTLPPEEYGMVVTDDPEIGRRLALPRAASACEPGYALLSGDGVVRYRTYDPGWMEHAFEQRVLLDAIAEGHP